MSDEEIIKPNVLARMSEAQYWKWRLTIEEQGSAVARAEIAQLKCRLKKVEIERDSLRLMAMQASVASAQKEVSDCKAEYDKIKSEIEEDLGVSLSNCTINPHTFEIEELPSN